MSELKAYQVICTDDIDRNEITENFSAPDFLAYDADEADKVIAKLKNEIELQKRLRDMALASVPNVLKVMKIIQHNKYKRCLAMADFCESQHDYYNTLGNGFWLVRGAIEKRDEYRKKASDFWWKWHKRWLKIAEQFKDGK